VKAIRVIGLFLLAAALTLAFLGLVGKAVYRRIVPNWRQVEIEWSDGVMKTEALAAVVRSAEYVILGDSVALRGIDAGCLGEKIGPVVNLAVGNADIASYYATVEATHRVGADTSSQIAIVVAYASFFRSWTEERAEARGYLPTTLRGALHLTKYRAGTLSTTLQRTAHHILDRTWYRFYPRPIQVATMRDVVQKRIISSESSPESFDFSPSGLCGCDEEILPHHFRSFWIEARHCSSGSVPSFPTREAPSSYIFSKRNDPSGIPLDYPYIGYADVLRFLQQTYADVWLIVFPDKFGLTDPVSFDSAMSALAEEADVHLSLLTHLDVANDFYDEHHAFPSGMRRITEEISRILLQDS